MLVYRQQRLLQPGDYEVKIAHVRETPSLTTGNNARCGARCEKRRRLPVIVREYLVFTESIRLEIRIASYSAIGLALEDGEEIDRHDFVGYTARVQIGVREFASRTSELRRALASTRK